MKRWLWPLHEALKITALWSTYLDHFMKRLLWPLHRALLVLWTQNIYFRKHSHCFVKHLLWPLYEALTLTTSWSTYIDCVLWSTYFDHFMRHLLWPLHEALTLTTLWSTVSPSLSCMLQSAPWHSSDRTQLWRFSRTISSSGASPSAFFTFISHPIMANLDTIWTLFT